MVLGELLLSVECLAALFTLLFVGKLVLESPFSAVGRNRDASKLSSSLFALRPFSFFGSSRVVKRSLLNQHVARRMA